MYTVGQGASDRQDLYIYFFFHYLMSLLTLARERMVQLKLEQSDPVLFCRVRPAIHY